MVPEARGTPHAFDAAETTKQDDAPPEHYEIGDPQVDPSELSTESLMEMQPSTPTVTRKPATT